MCKTYGILCRVIVFTFVTCVVNSNRLRLSRDVLPVNYELKLQPFLGINTTVDGSVKIQLRVLKVVKRIKLHVVAVSIKARGLRIESSDESEVVSIRGTKKQPRSEFIIIRIRGRLLPTSNYTLIVDFFSKLNSEPEGFYTSTYWEQDDRQRFVAATQFWTANARRVFPCFDEPAMKATFDVILARREHMTALSNMPLISSTMDLEQPGWYWDQFATTVPMSTYLVAFVITEFPNRTLANVSNSRVTAWARGEMLDQTDHALQIGESALSYFEEYFGMELAIPKLDMVGLPFTSHNGMENWGLITYRESAFTFSDTESSVDTKQQSAELVTHEIAHQWFGNLVTFSWWTDLWLSEGFATYMSNVALDKIFPLWQILDQFVVTRLQSVMKDDSHLTSHPVSAKVQDPNKIHEVFGAIPYSKGASIIRMMSHILSESTFQRGLSNYLQTYKFINADQDDLWTSLTNVAVRDGSLVGGMTLKQVLDSWTLQPGFPVVTVSRPDNFTAKLTQRRFYLGMADQVVVGEAEDDLKWWVPVTFTDETNPYFEHTKPRTWLRPQADHLTVTGLPSIDKWVIFNLQQTGFYRVNYDEATWSLLVGQLQRDHLVFPESNRAQIIDDALNLARAGLLPYSVALNVTKYLRNEEAYAPWLAAFNNIRYLDVMLRSSPQYGAFQSYLKWLLEHVIDEIGLANNRLDGMLTQQLRKLIEEWTCKLDHPACLELVTNLTNSIINNNTTQVEGGDGDIGGVWCAAVRHGGWPVWQAVWRHFIQTPNKIRREALGKSLGCSTQTWLINRYLESGLHGAELLDAVRWALQTGAGQQAAWRLMWKERRTLVRRFRIFPTILTAVAQDFFSDYHQFMLRSLLELAEPETRQSLTGLVATVNSNAAWHARSYAPIQLWLENTGFSSNLQQDYN